MTDPNNTVATEEENNTNAAPADTTTETVVDQGQTQPVADAPVDSTENTETTAPVAGSTDSVDYMGMTDAQFEEEENKIPPYHTTPPTQTKTETPPETSTTAPTDATTTETTANTATDAATTPTGEAGTQPTPEKPAAGTEDAAIDYKQEFEKLTAPFTANGQKLNVRSVEEAQQLMQKGANYEFKMSKLSKYRGTISTIEENKITDEDINMLIELKQKKPEAIAKMLRDSGIDPLDVDTDKAAEYQVGNYQVSSNIVELEEAVRMAKSSEEGNSVIEDIGALWDPKSRELLLERPAAIINTLIADKKSGVYDKVMYDLNRQRALDGLRSVEYISAYAELGSKIRATMATNTASNPQAGTSTQAGTTTGAATSTQTPKGSAATLTNNDKANQASPVTKTPTTPKNNNQVNFMQMSDADFEKLDAQIMAQRRY